MFIYGLDKSNLFLYNENTDMVRIVIYTSVSFLYYNLGGKFYV